MLRDNFGYVSFESLKDNFIKAGYHVSVGNERYGFVAYKKDNKTDKAIACFMAGAYNIRGAVSAKRFANDLIKQLMPSAEVSEENVLTVVYDDKHGHHYISKNVIYFNEKLGCATVASFDKNFKDEVTMLKDAARFKKAVRNTYAYAHPESIHYVIWGVILTVIVTTIAFGFTRDYDVWGYSAAKVFAGEPYRLITYMFSHANLRHLLGNMVSLVIIGSLVNKIEGNIHFAIIYFGGGILAAIFNCLWSIATTTNMTTNVVGASGAIFALLGAVLVETFINYDMEVERGNVIIYIIIVMISSNIGGNISVSTHIFGFIAGIILGCVCCLETRRRHKASLEKFTKKERYYDEKYKDPNSSYAGPSNISRM